jgi:hypothetical protein
MAGFTSVTANAQAAPGTLQQGVSVSPDSVTVGDPFRVIVRIRAPRGAIIEFPSAPDSTGAVELLDPIVVQPSTDSTVVDQSATYRLTAWDIGDFPIRFSDVLITEDGRTRRVPLGGVANITVVSVLPADSAQRVPKPPRGVFTPDIPLWWWLLIAAVVSALALLIWRSMRRRVRPASTVAADPYADAQKEFARLDAMGFAQAGEQGHYAAMCSDVLRTYLSRVLPAALVSHTTVELITALRGDRLTPLTRLQRVLHDVDLVKFAGEQLPAERALGIAAECKGVVDAVHLALHPVDERKAA